MAPMKSTKRARSASKDAGNVAKVLRSQGVAKSKYNALVDAIAHPMAEGFSEECRKMLTNALPLSICYPVDKRHEIQTEVVDMIGTLVAGVAAKLKAAVDAETAASAEVLDKDKALALTLEKATTALCEAKEALEAKKATLGTATTALAEAEAALTKSQAEQKKGDKEITAQGKEKEKVESVIASLGTLTSGEVEAGTLKSTVSGLVSFAKTLSVEKSLLEAMPSSLVKGPDARGSFDQMILQTLSETFKKKLGEVEATIAGLSPASQERAAAVAAAETAVTGAKAAKDAASEAVLAAQTTVAEATAAKGAAKLAKDEHEPASKTVLEALAEKTSEAETFNSTVDIFEELKVKSSVKPAEEAPAEAAA